jgi:pyruvate kinase
LTEGKLGSRRHINLPGVKVSLPALTAKDIKDVKLGLELGVDFIALSFVREARDLLQLREMFEEGKPHPLVIAKIEDQQAILNLEAIVQEADAIMVARGDLGIEIPYEELPIVQRRIVKTCLRIGRPVIVATHMLESMIEAPMPTRAEVTDVANAVFEEADAIMLSGETTVGKYPLKCIEVFDKIATRIERSGSAQFHDLAELTTARQKLVKSAVVMANELKAAALLVFTRQGSMAQYASWMRPHYSPIYALCESGQTANEMALCWGVTPFVMPFDFINPQNTIETALKDLAAKGSLKTGSTVVIIGAISVGTEIVDAVQMRTV